MNKCLLVFLAFAGLISTASAEDELLRADCIEELRQSLGEDIDTESFEVFVNVCLESYEDDPEGNDDLEATKQSDNQETGDVPLFERE